MPTPTARTAAPRRVYVMYRKAWWRLTPEEWWWFVAAHLRSGTAGFPAVNLIGRPRAVVQQVAPDGTVTYTSGDAAVWVEPIDGWQRSDWATAATRLEALGMADAASAPEPWPAGVTPASVTSPVYSLEDYQGESRPAAPARKPRRR